MNRLVKPLELYFFFGNNNGREPVFRAGYDSLGTKDKATGGLESIWPFSL